MLTRPIPDNAYGVVEKIRRDVPRPSGLPKPESENGNYLRWQNLDEDCCDKALHHGLSAVYCPLGFHPESLCSSPTGARDFKNRAFDDVAVKSFMAWWDEQKNARSAVNAVWGKSK